MAVADSEIEYFILINSHLSSCKFAILHGVILESLGDWVGQTVTTVGAPAAERAWWSVGSDYDNSMPLSSVTTENFWSVTQFPLNSQKSKQSPWTIVLELLQADAHLSVNVIFYLGGGLCLLESYNLRKVITKLL